MVAASMSSDCCGKEDWRIVIFPPYIYLFYWSIFVVHSNRLHKDIFIMDAMFFDYISVSYPPLSSLSLFLIIPFSPSAVLVLFSCYMCVFLYMILCICVKPRLHK